MSEQIEHARALHQQGQLEAADAVYRDILATHPENAEANYRLGNVLKDKGELDAALAAYDRAIHLNPNFAVAFCNRAVILGLMKKLPESLASYDCAIRINPSDALALCNRGILLIIMDRKEAALASFDSAIAVQPNFFTGHFSRAALLQELKRWAPALESYERAIAIDPNHALTHFNRGTVQKAIKQWSTALVSYNRAIQLQPDFFHAYVSRAEVLSELNLLTSALESFDMAIKLNAQEASTYNNRGALLQKMGRHEAALADYDQAISKAPNYAEAHFNRGGILQELKRLEAAQMSYARAILEKPDYAEAYVNQGVLLEDEGALDQAISSFETAISIDPGLAEAHYNLALTQLKAGQFVSGWKNYEWRWRATTGPVFREKRNFTQPLWLGQPPLAGRTILLYGEQGLGDSIQFCRYIRLVANLGARIILEVPEPLVKFCATSLRGVAHVIGYGDPPPAFDFQCPLMSLPLAFGTTLETIPPANIISADPIKVHAWQQRLGARVKPRVGLTWSGNRTSVSHRRRHLKLSNLLPYLSSDFQYVCLQTDIDAPDKITLDAAPDILQFGEEVRGFDNTAALCECMDLIISVDTSIAHLSGTLGIPTWLLLAFNADWRWQANRADSPWYPSMRLYRQRFRDDWNEVFVRVATDLGALRNR